MDKYIISEAFNKLKLTENTYEDKIKAARSLNTPSDILLKLANDSDGYIRWEVARNPNAPPEALKLLARDSKKDVRQHVAENSSTSPDILSKLAKSKNFGIRLGVVRNLNAPLESLKLLAEDPNEFIKGLARDRLPYEFNEDDFGYTDDDFDDY